MTLGADRCVFKLIGCANRVGDTIGRRCKFRQRGARYVYREVFIPVVRSDGKSSAHSRHARRANCKSTVRPARSSPKLGPLREVRGSSHGSPVVDHL